MQNLGVTGIVAEYNPFHLGHAWMIRTLRKLGAHTVVCVMSGPFVQRAEPAFLPTFTRAQAAVAGGVDLVLRLPTPYATASAEAFGAAGAGLLASLGCVDVLAFGAECEDTAKLAQIARALQSAEFSGALKNQLDSGVSFAVARMRAVETLLPGAGEVLQSPNNILGVEYCKALETSVPDALAKLAEAKTARGENAALPYLPRPMALPRLGAAHDGSPRGGIASASWLRGKAAIEGVEALADWVPEACLPLYKAAAQSGEAVDAARWELALLARLRGKSAADFAPYSGAGEGLDVRLAAAAQRAVSAQELYVLAKTKRFAHSRVRRAALAAAMELPRGLGVVPPFAQVLAANGRGLALLKRAKMAALVPVSTSLAKLAKTDAEAARVAVCEAASEDLYALCRQKPGPGGAAFTRPAFFAKD